MSGLLGPILVLLGVLLAAAPGSNVSAGEAQPHDRPNHLQAVDFAPLPAGGALVRLIFARQAQSPPSVLVNHHPTRRITFDFPDTLAASGRQLIEIGPSGLRSIQIVTSGTRTRVILNLDRPFAFDTVLRGTILMITLRRQNWGIARAAGKWTDETDFTAPRHGLREVGFERSDSGEGRIFVDVSDASVPVEIRREANTVVVDLFDTQIPKSLLLRLDARDFGTQIWTIDTYPVGGHARIAVELAGATDVSVFQFNRRLILTPHLEAATR
ncbi:MAG TPA: AMIN domain-containing protein [Burkholderiales bacterium]|nr:AMIN domain-containing protein [Burkholderiales bacterium]